MFSKHCTSKIVLATIAATIGCSMQIGFNISCLNAPAKHIIAWTVNIFEPPNGTMSSVHALCVPSNLNMTAKKACEKIANEKPENTIYYSFLVSIYVLGAMFGSILSGPIGDFFWPKRAILYNNVFAYVGTTMMFFSYYAGFAGYFMFLFGRFFVGLNAGLISGLVPSYLTDISSYKIRGIIGGLHTFFVTFGLFMGAFLGVFLGECGRWNTTFIFLYFPITVCLVVLPFCPESPRFTTKPKKQEKKMKDASKAKEEKKPRDPDSLLTFTVLPRRVTFCQLFRKPYRWPLLLCVSMVLAQQFCGIAAVFYYSTNIFENDAGLSNKGARIATSGLMFFNVSCCAFAVWLGNRPWMGRRFMILTGLGGCSYIMLLLFILLKLLDCTNPNFPRFPTNYITIALLVLYTFLYNAGPNPAIWVVVSESFHSAARSKATPVVSCVNWFFNFLVGLTFNPIREKIGVHAFLIFVCVGGSLVLFMFLFLPETKGKSVEQMEKEMQAGRIVACKTDIRKRKPPATGDSMGIDSLDSMKYF